MPVVLKENGGLNSHQFTESLRIKNMLQVF